MNQTDKGPNATASSLSSLSRVLMLAGIIGIVFGAIHLYAYLGPNAKAASGPDALFNAGLGVVALVSSRLLAKGKLAGAWLVGIDILASLAYSWAMGRGFNVVMAGIGVLLAWQLYQLKKAGHLR